MSIASRRLLRSGERQPAVAFWVSPSGNDANTGTQGSPFATLTAARNKVRQVIAGGRPPGGIVVNVMAGTYPQSATLSFVDGDSGTPESPITWRAVGGKVKVTGSVEIPSSAYQTVPTAIANLFPAGIRSQVCMVDLAALGVDTPAESLDPHSWGETGATIVVDGKALTLARYPNNGWLPVQAGSTAGTVNDLVVLSTDDPTVLSWAGNTGGARLCSEIVFQWAAQMMEVTAINSTNKTITAQPHSDWGLGTPDTNIGRYYIFNLPQALDSASEYYIDTSSGKAYFVPGAKASVTVLKSTIIHCYFTSHLTFEGIDTVEGRFMGYLLSGTDYVTIKNATVHSVNSGIILDNAYNTIIDNVDVYDIGCNGVNLYGGNRQKLSPGNNTLQNSRVHDCAKRQPNYNPAVSIYGVGNKVLRNNLYNSPQMLISLSGNDHLIQDNWVHHGVLDNSDAGAFYTGRDWTDRGNVINRNWFSDIGVNDGRFTVAVYMDDCSSGFTVTNNIIVDSWYGLHHCGRDNFFSNNVIIRAQSMAWHVGNWGANHAPNQQTLKDRYNAMVTHPEYDAAAWSKYAHFANILSDEPAVPKYNTVSNCLIADSAPGGIDNYEIFPQVTVTGNQTVTTASLGLDTVNRTALSTSVVTNGAGSFKGIDISRLYH